MTLPRFLLLLCAAVAHSQTFTVATVGDSFADSLYNSMRSRPDLLRRHDIRLLRWSRPIVGLTRSDLFDYPAWLRNAAELGKADLCFVEIGANDMQSIPAADQQWIAYGSPAWKDAYHARTAAMARTLTERRCGQILWVLQPAFEQREIFVCHRELINRIQREALRVDRTRILETITDEAAYAKDKTHFNRAYLLQLGPAMFQLVDTARQVAHNRCLSCHRNVNLSPSEIAMHPLRWSQAEPKLTGASAECRIAVAKKTRPNRRRTHKG